MKTYKITGTIKAKDEDEARFKATIEGGNGILEFEEIKMCKNCGIYYNVIESEEED